MTKILTRIARSYYGNFKDCLKTTYRTSTITHVSLNYEFLISDHISKEYHHTNQSHTKLQASCGLHGKNLPMKAEQSIKLFDQHKSNNFIYSDGNDSQSGRGDDIKIHGGIALDGDDSVNNTPRTNSFNQTKKAVSTLARANTANLSHISQQTIEAITQFFYDEPFMPYRPPPPHELEDSPCNSIIRFDNHFSLYSCTLHPELLFGIDRTSYKI